MKKQLLIIGMMLLMAGISKAQYQPVLEEGKSWNYFYTDFFHQMDSLILEGDTLVNGKKYKQLIAIKSEYGSYKQDDFYLSAFLREDTIAGKMWILSPEEQNEVLIYDMELSLGDKITIDYHEYEVIEITNSNDQKIIKLNDPTSCAFNTVLMIEGVGSTGSMRCSQFAFYFGTMICAHSPSGDLLWECDYSGLLSDFDHRQCWIDVMVDIDEHKVNLINIWPNPVSKSISIELPHEQSDFTYQIIDAKGRTCATGQITGACQEIDVAALANGIYVLSLKNDKQHLSETIIIEQ